MVNLLDLVGSGKMRIGYTTHNFVKNERLGEFGFLE